VKLETDAKLFVQLKIKEGKIDLVWSYMLDFENEANPFPERKSTIEKWRRLSETDIVENRNILSIAVDLVKNGLKPKDALHVACAIDAKCEYFLTTDDQVLKKMANSSDISVLNPTDFIKIIEEL
jgi:predicted nucleic acid-binding protein